MRYDEREWKIGFNMEDGGEGRFGCTAASVPGDNVWAVSPRGVALCGDCDEVLAEAEALEREGFVPDAVIAFFSRNHRIEATLARLDEIFPGVPFCGGGAAPGGDGLVALYPQNGDAALLLIRDARYSFTLRFRNLHDISTRTVALEGPDSRTVTYVNDGGHTAAPAWLDALRSANACRAESFENVTLTTDDGYNLHLSGGEGCLCTGSDIPDSRRVHIGLLSDEEARRRLDGFLGVPGELVFGCAGLRSMVPEISSKSVCGFLYGEILTANGHPRFANLMMSAISARVI